MRIFLELFFCILFIGKHLAALCFHFVKYTFDALLILLNIVEAEAGNRTDLLEISRLKQKKYAPPDHLNMNARLVLEMQSLKYCLALSSPTSCWYVSNGAKNVSICYGAHTEIIIRCQCHFDTHETQLARCRFDEISSSIYGHRLRPNWRRFALLSFHRCWLFCSNGKFTLTMWNDAFFWFRRQRKCCVRKTYSRLSFQWRTHIAMCFCVRINTIHSANIIKHMCMVDFYKKKSPRWNQNANNNHIIFSHDGQQDSNQTLFTWENIQLIL